MPTRRSVACASGLVLATVALAGCTQSITMQPAPDSNNPLCAEVMVRLPDSISNQSGDRPTTAGVDVEAELKRVWTDAQATAAWGTNGTVRMVCGVPEPGPVALPCSSWGGIDWLVEATDPTNTRMITYGRSPATQVEFDPRRVQGAAVWDALARPLQQIPASKTCEASD